MARGPARRGDAQPGWRGRGRGRVNVAAAAERRGGGVPADAVDQLASALALAPDAFKRMYAFEMPAQGDLLIFVSRTNQRAHWAAQLAHDAGWCRCGCGRGGRGRTMGSTGGSWGCLP
jgi:hypothetical protein